MDRTDATETCMPLPLDLRSFKLRRPVQSRRNSPAALASTSVPSSSSRAPVLSRLPASAQHLPTEIILKIFGYALPSIYDKAARFRFNSTAFYNEVSPDFRSVLKGTQLDLHRAAQVCRAWYPVANELLYGCPFFDSSSSVRSFSRTLSSSPPLGHFVKEVWVFNEEGPKRTDPIGMKRKNARRV
ncbi:hypothetical protein PHLCEN_2v12906 [Hermanssonia centrifuga]|uniref:Uncharacterized protein n=1 Tax=Hermanssonia centrifuga TaxID=98765 RepID=A0A2R6NGZ8_9APHY|nr:hypothetical protein PHLCEN_2v12906 [Hermanssonia centrifuga]